MSASEHDQDTAAATVALDDALLRRGRALLERLAALTAARHAAETDATTSHDEALTAGTSAYERASADAERQYTSELRRMESEHRTAMAELESSTREKIAATERRHATRRTAVDEKGDTSAVLARDQWQEARWLAETVYEASQDKPAEELALRLRLLDGRSAELTAAHEAAGALLRKYRQPVPPDPVVAVDDGADVSVEHCMQIAQHGVARLHRLRLARLFRGYVLAVPILLVVGAAAAGAMWWAGWRWQHPVVAGATGTTVVIVGAILAAAYVASRRRVQSTYLEICAAVQRGEHALARSRQIAEAQCAQHERALVRQRDEELRRATERYEPLLGEIEAMRAKKVAAIDAKYPPRLEALRKAAETSQTDAAAAHVTAIEAWRTAHERERTERDAAWVSQRELIETTYREKSAALEAAWGEGMREAGRELAALRAAHASGFPDWDDPVWAGWSPPTGFAASVPIGRIAVDRRRLPGGLPADERLRTDVPVELTMPIALDFPDRCSLLVETDAAGRPAAVGAVQTAMMRLLTTLPPGKVRFTIIDPVGLGESFAGFMHLADYEEASVAGRIWTEPRHIEQRLAELTEHMETVIQKYLRNEFEAIAQYNERAGEIAEPYRFLVIADFPAKFSDAAIRRLASILRSGPRCGVFTLLIRDPAERVPKEMDLDDLRNGALAMVQRDGVFVVDDSVLGEWPLTLDDAPPESFLTEKLHLIGEAARDASRVEVPFDMIAPDVDETWTGDCTRALTVPLGRSGATKRQDLVIGPGTSQHALIAGKTGSGKSTLLHVLITNLALWYSPDEVQFYLVDFKKGVEFKTYARHALPHARAVAVESDREFGLSVLQRIDGELKTRGERFREIGVQDLGQFRQRTGEPLPRILLIVDEFQEMFVEDDRIGQEAALLLDRLVRQGRAFGVHVILGSQTLGGAYTLTRSTMGQMQVRIALQCTEADAYMIMNDENSAARLLARPGEAIYNDAGGAIEANSPFQICWLPEPVRDTHLARVRELAQAKGIEPDTPMVVFEGNVPANIADNHRLAERLREPEPARSSVRAWLGEAISIKDPTAAEFVRRAGRNLLVVGQQDETALAMTTSMLVSMAAHLAGASTDEIPAIVLLDGTPADAPHRGFLEQVASALPVPIECVGYRDVPAALERLVDAINTRNETDAVGLPPIFLVIHGLQRFRMLRASDDFGFSMRDESDAPPAPDRQFGEILQDGPPLGVHTVAWIDTANNINRTFDRTRMREFEMRVLMQMSATDSTQLVDAPVASNLGLQRMLYFNEEAGILEKFRPYALPELGWIEAAAKAIRTRT